MKLIYCVLIFFILFFYPSESAAKLYKWTDENGKVHFSDKPPHPEETVEDVKEYESIEDKAEPEEPEKSSQLDFSNVTVSNIKTKVIKKGYSKSSKSKTGSSGSNSGGKSGSSSYVWVLLKADISSVDDYAGYVKVKLQAVDREGYGIKTAVLSGNIVAGQKLTLSHKLHMPRKSLRKIRQWRIMRIYTSRRK